MKRIISLFVFLCFALPVNAQTAGGQIPDIVFGEEEKQIISDYLKKKMGLPETANTTPGKKSDDEEASGSDDEEAASGAKAKKEKKSKKDKNKGKGKGKAKGKGKNKQMPPGLAKRKELPPGLARRHTLPPGLAVREFPQDLAEQLPEPEKGTERIIADDNVVLIEKATGRILDIILGGPGSSGSAQ